MGMQFSADCMVINALRPLIASDQQPKLLFGCLACVMVDMMGLSMHFTEFATGLKLHCLLIRSIGLASLRLPHV